MNDNQKLWLPHLTNAIPYEAKKNNISMYTITLEGWRRGLEVKFFNHQHKGKKDIGYSMSDKKKTHLFFGSNGDLNSKQSIEICDHKDLTYKYLVNANVPIPEGKKFSRATEKKTIIEYARKIGYPLVVKPSDESGGKGVTLNIQDDVGLNKALSLLEAKFSNSDIIVQKYIAGKEVRVYVLKQKVLSAIHRMPANVVGNGKTTIKELIEQKNEFRKSVPHLHHRPIKINKELVAAIKHYDYNLDSVPEKGQRIYLNKKSNISTGGDPIEFSDYLTTTQRKIAIDALNAIPHLIHGGVDMIINEANNECVILEVNAYPGLGSHLFPIKGKAYDIPKEIVDLYFPYTETKQEVGKSNIYYDFKGVYEALQSQVVREISLLSPESISLQSKRLIIKGEIDLIRNYDWIKRKALDLNLSGFIRRVDEKEVEIIIGAIAEQDISNFKEILTSHQFLRIDSINEENWNLPLKKGFDLINSYSSMSKAELEEAILKINQEINLYKKKNESVHHRINILTQSRFWRYTNFLRRLKKSLK